MRVLIATTELQGVAHGDYSYAVDGELVTPVTAECDSPDTCGCARGFPGLASARATTTAMVVDRPFISADELRDAVADSLERGGWMQLLTDAAEHEPTIDADAEFDDIVDEHLEAIDEIGRCFPVGTIIERNGTLITSRSHRIAA